MPVVVPDGDLVPMPLLRPPEGHRRLVARRLGDGHGGVVEEVDPLGLAAAGTDDVRPEPDGYVDDHAPSSRRPLQPTRPRGFRPRRSPTVEVVVEIAPAQDRRRHDVGVAREQPGVHHRVRLVAREVVERHRQVDGAAEDGHLQADGQASARLPAVDLERLRGKGAQRLLGDRLPEHGLVGGTVLKGAEVLVQPVAGPAHSLLAGAVAHADLELARYTLQPSILAKAAAATSARSRSSERT